jgi:3-oxoacyl-[acyl-carrier protein] reductase
MDLGLAGRTAIVCGASKGLGKGVAEALAAAGVNLVLNARSEGPLNQTARAIEHAHDVSVTPVACDITTQEGREAVLAAAPHRDILVTNSAGPKPGDFRQFNEDDWRAAVEANMITPIALIRATAYGVAERGFGRILNITSSAVKAPLPFLELSNGARAGLTGAVSALSRKLAGQNVTINNICPGMHATDRLMQAFGHMAKASGSSQDDTVARALKDIPAGRFGTAEEFGAICAFFCSVHAGFVTGQNLVVDGGQSGALLK